MVRQADGQRQTSTDYLANVMTVSTGSYAQKGKPFTIGTTVSFSL